MDTEFSKLREDVDKAIDFQTVLKVRVRVRLRFGVMISVKVMVRFIISLTLTLTLTLTVLKAHRNFLSTIIRLSCVDNVTVQEGIERILQVCLRFIAVCRVLQQQEEDDLTYGFSSGTKSSSNDCDKGRVMPIVIPTEEIEGIRKEFITQISYLFQVMRRVENREFMFRLDFNGYLSTLTNDLGAGFER
jgi:hypothetical protein